MIRGGGSGDVPLHFAVGEDADFSDDSAVGVPVADVAHVAAGAHALGDCGECAPACWGDAAEPPGDHDPGGPVPAQACCVGLVPAGHGGEVDPASVGLILRPHPHPLLVPTHTPHDGHRAARDGLA